MAIKGLWMEIGPGSGSEYLGMIINNIVLPEYSRSRVIQISIIRTLGYISERYYECRNPIRQFNFLNNQVINGIIVWFLHLLGLLYHSEVDRRGILHVQVQYYQGPTQLIHQNIICV